MNRYEVDAGYDRNKEIREAIRAGERALYSLRAAENSLDEARGWGVLDMLGGNLITGLVKHSKVGDASRYVEAAKRDMAYFQDELRDIQDLQGLNIAVDDILTFADFFWDGFFADILIQSKINDSRKKIQDAIRRTESVVRRLKNSI